MTLTHIYPVQSTFLFSFALLTFRKDNTHHYHFAQSLPLSTNPFQTRQIHALFQRSGYKSRQFEINQLSGHFPNPKNEGPHNNVFGFIHFGTFPDCMSLCGMPYLHRCAEHLGWIGLGNWNFPSKFLKMVGESLFCNTWCGTKKTQQLPFLN